MHKFSQVYDQSRKLLADKCFQPKLSACIELCGVTGDGMPRHPSFKGLVED